MKKRIAAAVTVAAALGLAVASRRLPELGTDARPEPTAAEVAAGLQAFADDLTAGDRFALEAISDRGEMPFDPQTWADWPNDWYRQARIAYLGDDRGAEMPNSVFDQLDAAGWEPGDPIPDHLRRDAA